MPPLRRLPAFQLWNNLTMKNSSMSFSPPQLSFAGLLALACWAWFWGQAAWVEACNIPVFRYALEQWPSDAYQAFVFHRGSLSETENAAIEQLRPNFSGATPPANLEVRLVDLDRLSDGSLRQLWEAQAPSEPKLPWVVLTYPPAETEQRVAWAGPLNPESVKKLVDSPARQEISKKLLTGDSIVWVLLASGNEAKDKAAAQQLQTFLAKLEKTLLPSMPLPVPAPEGLGLNEIPTTSGEGPATGELGPADPVLALKFPVVRIARSDPAEAVLVKILLHTEKDLEPCEDPMTFPVFGRGRVLYAVVGRGINEANVADACSFLVGPCSCEVKNQNPGTDLLMAVDWERGLPATLGSDVTQPPLTSFSALMSQPEEQEMKASAPAEVAPAPAPQPSHSENGAAAPSRLAGEPGPSVFLRIGLVLAAVAAWVGLATLWMLRRKTRGGPRP